MRGMSRYRKMLHILRVRLLCGRIMILRNRKLDGGVDDAFSVMQCVLPFSGFRVEMMSVLLRDLLQTTLTCKGNERRDID